MTKLEQYVKWKNSDARMTDVKGSMELLAADLTKKDFTLARVKEMLVSTTPESIELREIILKQYRNLPLSEYHKRRGLKNIARETILVTYFDTYPELNREMFYKVMAGKSRNPRSITPATEVVLLEKIGYMLVEVFGDPEIYVKKIGLDHNRLNMAYFYNFDKKYDIIADEKALEINDEDNSFRTVQIFYIDIRYGTIHKIKNKGDVDKLLDMKDWFVFGTEK